MRCTWFPCHTPQCAALRQGIARGPLTIQPSLSLPRGSVRGYLQSPVTLPNLELYESQILKMAKSLGAFHERARKFYETGAVIRRPWARFTGDGSWTVIHFDSCHEKKQRLYTR